MPGLKASEALSNVSTALSIGVSAHSAGFALRSLGRMAGGRKAKFKW